MSLKGSLFSQGESEEQESVGKCAAIAKPKWIVGLEVRFSDRDWETFLYSFMTLNARYKPHSCIVMEFESQSYHKRLIIEGRNLEAIKTHIFQHRMEWIRPVDRDMGNDGEPVITKITVEDVPKR
jgi:hypothetical protein